MKFLLINPAAPQWRARPGTRPPLATRIFRFSMLSSLCVAAAAPPGVETRILDEEVEPGHFADPAFARCIGALYWSEEQANRADEGTAIAG